MGFTGFCNLKLRGELCRKGEGVGMWRCVERRRNEGYKEWEAIGRRVNDASISVMTYLRMRTDKRERRKLKTENEK